MLKYMPGKSIGKTDRLSRRPDQQKGIEKNNKDQMLIKQKQIKKAEVLVKENSLREKIKRAQR